MKPNFIFLVAILLRPLFIFTQVPILNSQPLITDKVILLDFDGEVVSGSFWNSGNPINALPSTMSVSEITLTFKRIAEDFRPFDVNVTTDVTRFNNAQPNSRVRVIFTPTSAWFGAAGGVAFLDCFNWGGTPGTPCWVFDSYLGNNKTDAEAGSHEIGHTLGLYHQSTYSNPPSCVKTDEYNPGTGTGVIGWAPIMGVGYYQNVTTWFNGTSSAGCTIMQLDHGSTWPGITSSGFLNFLPDDIGNTFATGKILNLNTTSVLDSGIITTPSDVDVFRFTLCNTRYVSIAVKPWALDTITYEGANLDIGFELYDASNTLLLSATPANSLQTLAAATLTAGTYYFKIDGLGSVNYSDYGSLGKYFVEVNAANPPAISSTIITNASICAGQSVALTYTSNGTPAAWQWTVSGGAATNTYNTQNPAITFTAAQIYTISLLATNGTLSACATTQTFDVGTMPTVTVTNSPSVCPGVFTTLTASGASSYLWLPANVSGSAQIVNPTVNTTYTVIGSNGSCNSLPTLRTLSVYPNFTPSLVASNTLVCSGYTVLLTASGGNNYTYSPNASNTNTAIVSPAISTNYIVQVSNGNCVKSVSQLVEVLPDFTITAVTTPSLLCPNTSAVLSASGAVNYTFNPGGITTGTSVIITPSGPVSYTINGTNGACTHTLVKPINVVPDFTIAAPVFNNIACPGQSLSINLTGASFYTLTPGGTTTGSLVLLPLTGSDYTITGTDGFCTKWVVKTLTVNPDFNLQANTSVPFFCQGSPVILSATGAASYTFNPGGIMGSTAVVSPTTSMVYTVTGSDGVCTNSILQPLDMFNLFNLGISASNSIICKGQSLVLSASGANSYTFNPGNIASSLAFVSPTVSTTYTLTGNDGSCNQTTTQIITVSPDFSVQISVSSPTFCAGESVSLTAVGAVSYTFVPGNITANPAVVSPASSIIYTITGSNSDNCLNKTTALLTYSVCDPVGIYESGRDKNISIYPNPASTFLTIESATEFSGLLITNATGSLILEKKGGQKGIQQIPIEEWANGIYFVILINADNRMVVQKIIVQH